MYGRLSQKSLTVLVIALTLLSEECPGIKDLDIHFGMGTKKFGRGRLMLSISALSGVERIYLAPP